MKNTTRCARVASFQFAVGRLGLRTICVYLRWPLRPLSDSASVVTLVRTLALLASLAVPLRFPDRSRLLDTILTWSILGHMETTYVY